MFHYEYYLTPLVFPERIASGLHDSTRSVKKKELLPEYVFREQFL
jgi:hypothetical protein